MTKFLIAATTALMAGSAVLAQPAPVAPPAPPAPPVADREMTRDEVVAMVRDHFSRLDTDKNGSITDDEVMKGRAGPGGPGERRVMRIERDGGPGEKIVEIQRDGGPGERVVEIERDGAERGPVWAERRDPAAAFDRIDANKDGLISRDEFTKSAEQRIERRIEIREDRKEARKDGKLPEIRELRMRGSGMGMGMMGGRMIVMADNDHDGKITLAEAESMALQHFDQMDSNHDGRVTPEERRSGRPMMIKKVIEERKTAS